MNVVLGATLLAFACAGCGYNAGFAMPEGTRSIFVKVFENKTFYRDLDFELTELVKKEVLARTDLKVVGEKDADLILSCSLDKVSKSVVREDVNSLPQEVQLSVSISAGAKDRSGNTVLSNMNLTKSVRYVVILGQTEDAARARALREIAEELVYRMAEGWGWKGAAVPQIGKQKADSNTHNQGK
jgi:hypothetical protein